MSEPAGWYTNPDGTNSERYWDGARWTHDVRPPPGPPAADPPPPGAPTIQPTSDFRLDPTVRADIPLQQDDPARITEPPPDPHPAGEPPPPGHPFPLVEGADPDQSSKGSGSTLGSPAELLRILFDLSMERRLTAEGARVAYRLGALATMIVVTLRLLVGIQAGGSTAVLVVIIFPLVGLLALLHLRAVLQAAVGSGPVADDDGPGPA